MVASERRSGVYNRIDGPVTGNVLQAGSVHGPVYLGQYGGDVSLRSFLLQPYVDLPPDPPEAWLLQPRFRVVPYLGREDLLTDLQTWCTGRSLFSVGLLTGEGGSGKSRAAAELCTRLDADGWDTGFAPVTEALTGGVAEKSTLLVIDYPDQRVDVLGSVIERLACRTRGPRVRVLLLARRRAARSHWWTALDGASHRAASSYLHFEHDLTEHVLTHAERRSHAEVATVAFARQRDLDDAAPHVSTAGLDTPLLIHVAALLAVHGETVRHSVPGSVGRDVLAQLLVREQRRWARLQNSHQLADLHDVHAARAVLVAVLTHPTAAETPELLTVLPELSAPEQRERRDRIRRWLADLYPGEPLLSTFGPDLLVEELLAVAADRLDLADVVAALHTHPACTARHLSHLLDNLRLASERRSGPADVLRGLLTSRLSVLVDGALNAQDDQVLTALDNALARFDEGNRDSVDLALAALQLVSELPLYSVRGAHLFCTILRLGIPLFRHLAATDPTSLADIAIALHLFADKCHQAGQFEEGLSATEECVRIRRRIMANDLAQGRSELVLELANLSTACRQLRKDKALAAAEEAVQLGRPLAHGSDDDRYRLAAALHCLSSVQFELRLFDHAAATNSEALPLIRGLVNDQSGCESLLADALTIRGALLTTNGQHREGLATLVEAIAYRERLAEQEPDHHVPALVLDLHNLAQIQSSNLGNHEEARIAAKRAVDLARGLAKDNLTGHQGSLIHALVQLTVVLLQQGHTTAAVQTAAEAVGLGRRLAGTPHGDRLLAISLQHFADAAMFAGNQHDEALAAAEEAVVLWRELAEFTADPRSPELATALRHLGHMYTRMGWDTQALPHSEEAVRMFRQIVDINPGYLPELAAALTHLSEVHVLDREEALNIGQEAVQHYQRLDRELVSGREWDFILARASVSDRYAELGRWDEALDEILGAAQLAERQVDDGSHLALVLAKLGDRYAGVGHFEKAHDVICKAIELYECMADGKLEQKGGDFAFAVDTLVRICQRVGDRAGAVSALELAVHHFGQLAESQPDAFLPRLTASLNSLRTAYAEDGRFTDALSVSQRATDIYQDLAYHHPERYMSLLADSLDRLSYLLAMCGDLTSALAASRRHSAVTEQLQRDDNRDCHAEPLS